MKKKKYIKTQKKRTEQCNKKNKENVSQKTPNLSENYLFLDNGQILIIYKKKSNLRINL